MEYDAQGRNEETADNIAHDLRHMWCRDIENEEPEQDAADEGGGAIEQAAAEDDAEAGTAQSGSQNLLPGGVGTHGTDFPQTVAGGSQRIFPGNDVAGQLVDGHHLVELGTLEGNKLHVRIFVEAAGGEDAVAQHEETGGVDAIVRGDAFHRLFDTGNLGTVLQQDVACFRGDGQRQGVAFFDRCFRIVWFFGHKCVK